MGEVIREYHRVAGHSGCYRLWQQMTRFFKFHNQREAERLTERVHGQFEVCQVCEPSRVPYLCPMQPTVVPPHLMDSVTIDLFAMPEVTHEGKKFDTLAVCVDKLSGWLTSEKVAKAMYLRWAIFGVPSLVHSDRASHFSAGWWRAICATVGVKVVYGQAFHHQVQ